VPNTVPLQVRTRPLWLLDVGSGAGFPGLPLKIMLPEAKVTLVEATQKKVRFLEHMVQLLGLKDVEVLNARAEDAGRLEQHRERYDVVVARAVAHLAVLAEYCLPLCRVGGRMIAPKGEDARQEAEESAQALMTLGGELVAIKPVVLPDFPEERYLIVVGKRARTPNAYPRRAGVPSKNPLM
jgi:16S rRNA (guanine527-N7)-methyltransferase